MKKKYIPLEVELVSCYAEDVMAASSGDMQVDTGYGTNPFTGNDSNYETKQP